jgi:hypothetical protein
MEKLENILSFLRYIGTQLVRWGIGAILGLWFSRFGTVPEGFQTQWTIALMALGALVHDLLCRLGNRYEERLPQEAADKVKEQVRDLVESVEKRLARFSPYFGVHTDHNVLEDILLSSHSIDTKAKWVVPFFVSRKLKDDFKSRNQVDFQTSARDYSELLAELIPNCSSTLHMSCPYIPTTWFKEAFASEPDKLAAALSNNLEEQSFPPHIKALMRADVSESKKRFVVIPDLDELKQFWHPDNRDALKCFLHFSNSDYGIQTRFAYRDSLCGKCNKCELPLCDFQVWDSKVAVEWQQKDTTCIMKIDLDGQYLDFFGKCFITPAVTCSAKDLLDKLAEIELGKTVTVWEQQVGNTGLTGAI